MFKNRISKTARSLTIFLVSLASIVYVSPASAALRDDDLKVNIVLTPSYDRSYEGFAEQAHFIDTEFGYLSALGTGSVRLDGNQLILENNYPDDGPFNYLFISSGNKTITKAVSLDGGFTGTDILIGKSAPFAISPEDIAGVWLNLNNHSQGHYVVEITTVPEPETYTLTLAGLALIGFALKRRGRVS